MSARFFITGAQGFVGRYVAAHLLTSRGQAEVAGIGRSPELGDRFPHSIRWAGARLPAPLPADLERALSRHALHYASIDLNDRVRMAQALRIFRPQVVLHLASALRDEAADDLHRTNVEGTCTLLHAIADSGVDLHRLIVCSTGGVYGPAGDGRPPFDETAPCHPADRYAASKLAAEEVSRRLSRHHGIETVWARLFNVVGAGEDDRHLGPELARQVAEIRSGIRAPIVEVGDLEATRDFIDVRDVARALATLVDHGAAGATYNVATGAESSARSLLSLALEVAGLQGSVEIRRRPGGDAAVRRHFADTRRLAALGFQPRLDLRGSMRDVVGYYMTRVAPAGRDQAPR